MHTYLSGLLWNLQVLNKNNNIQHTVTDTYIQDSRSNVVQRYFLLVFNYKIRSFKKAKEGA